MLLIERSDAFTLLQEALQDCDAGTPRVVLVEGAVGCGRSALVDVVAEGAAYRGAVVLRATATADETGHPLGVIRQLAAGPAGAALPRPEGAPGTDRIEAMHSFWASVRDLGHRTPVVICVDDLHHADELSRDYLLHLTRVRGPVRILLLLTESLHHRRDDPKFGTGLLRHPGFTRIRLERLGRAATGELLAGRSCAEADRLYAASGGNPLLLRALAEDPEPHAGGAYSQAVVACLHRCDPAAKHLAEILAVLDVSGGSGGSGGPGGPGGPGGLAGSGGTLVLAARLAGVSTATATRDIAALEAAGLLDGARFRHPAARNAVLDRMDRATRLDLHQRAADLAHHTGACAADVAVQLLAAGRADEDWARQVLRTAAEQFLADGDPVRATDCLEFARDAARDEAQRADLSLRLAAVAWRTNPAAAERGLAEPVDALRAHRLPPRQQALLARLLVSQGRIDEAADTLGSLAAAASPAAGEAKGDATGAYETPVDAVLTADLTELPRLEPAGHGWAAVPGLDPLEGLALLPSWGTGTVTGATRSAAPVMAGTLPAGPTSAGTAPTATAARNRPPLSGGAIPQPPADIRRAAAFWDLPDSGATHNAAAASAELFLRGVSLAEGTVEPVTRSLRALLYLGGPRRAMTWCQSFAEEAEQRGTSGWQAVFQGLHAKALLRQGDLVAAERTAAAALAAVPERAGSALLSSVIGTLVSAVTGQGNPERVAPELSRAAPPHLAGSVHGLEYLRARGHYFLATNRFQSALGDFLAIGRCMRRWGLDRPLILPWRTDVAQALLRLGDVDRAERFVTDQLDTRDGAHPRVRGISLRVRAALREPRERQSLLAKAVDELRRSEDRYELACAMADFGHTLRELGELNRAGMVNRRAHHLATMCGAQALRDRILPEGATDQTSDTASTATASATAAASGATSAAANGPYAELEARLSDSEKRVVMLAVHGHTNREIARSLFITVSTVEQHLTRIYRKLNISRRQDLPVDLQLNVSDIA